jgi:beta-mannosidase|eukprot:COSAG06_NODE_2105_length_7546_cov_10.050575_4_plen_393_part_00
MALPLPLLLLRNDSAYRQAAAAEEGSDDFTMFVRVNGEAIYARGANMVALDQLEGRTTDANYRRLVQSAAEAGMNMIRIWGGGSFLTSAYYSACDQLGVLVYHDMMFAVETGQPHLAYVSDTVEKELRHQIRRLSSHPSIAIWDGCNECRVVMHKDDPKPKPDPYYPDGTELYATFVLQTVVEEDKSRIVWPSCPASGWASGVHKLTGLPTGGPLVTRNDSAKGGKIEVHGPYRQGSGISSINPGGGDYLSQPPALPKPGGETGTQHPSVFISEFGSVGMSSFESMSATLAPEHWSVHGGTTEVDQCHGQHTAWCTGGNVMGYRNHMTDNQIHAAFGNSTLLNLSAVGAAAFQEQLYKSMMGQALDMKREMEEQRAVNSFGMLVWQLGEVWP